LGACTGVGEDTREGAGVGAGARVRSVRCEGGCGVGVCHPEVLLADADVPEAKLRPLKGTGVGGVRMIAGAVW
jgi:hypothetical protein